MLALPIFPGRLQPSIVGRSELNFRVRDGNGWTLALISTNCQHSSIPSCQLMCNCLHPENRTMYRCVCRRLRLPAQIVGQALGLLVPVSCIHYCTSTSNLSTSSSSRGLTRFRDGISHLEGGFTLRCLQRLSRPDLATLPWPW